MTPWIVMHYCMLSIFHVINVFVVSSMYSCKSYKQVEEMVILHLFIEHHYKSIVSIIRERHVLTLHLSTANCRKKLTTGCCCKNVAALYCTCYAIFLPDRVIPQFLKLWSIFNALWWNSNLLYFIEMLPCMVSVSANILVAVVGDNWMPPQGYM